MKNKVAKLKSPARDGVKPKLFILGLLFLGLIVSAFTLKAQQAAVGLRVTPISFDLSLNKGESNRQTIRVENKLGRTAEIVVSTQNFTAQGEQGGVTLTSEDTPFSLAKWVKVTPAKVTLKNNESQDFNVVITPPTNAEPGGHFGSIVFSTVPPKGLTSTGASVSQSVGALILGTIPGPVKENAVIESFSTDKPFYEFGPVGFTIRVKNNSTVHVKPIGVITIKNEITGTKSLIGVEGKNVLPGAIRQIPALWNPRFLLGKYTATANLNYGSQNFPLANSTSFIGFPVRIAIAVLIILIILFFFRKRLWKAFKIIAKG